MSKALHYQDEEFAFYGITGVFTYPAFRRMGNGKQMITQALNYINDQEEVDIIFLNCDERNVSFYEKCGFEFNDPPVLEGDSAKPRLTTERVAMKFVSSKARAYQQNFEEDPIYFGDELW